MIVDTHECWQNLIMDESLGDLQRLPFTHSELTTDISIANVTPLQLTDTLMFSVRLIWLLTLASEQNAHQGLKTLDLLADLERFSHLSQSGDKSIEKSFVNVRPLVL